MSEPWDLTPAQQQQLRQAHAEAKRAQAPQAPQAPDGPPCDYDTGTAGSGPRKCGKPSKHIWRDIDSHEDRPVCTGHARMAQRKFLGQIRPIPMKEN